MFENEYTVNRGLIKEYVNKIVGKRLIIWGISVAVVALLLAILNPKLRCVMAICACFTVVYPFIAVSILSKDFENSSKILNDGEIKKTQVIFNEDNIVMNEGKAHVEINYNQIKQVIHTKNLIILKTSAKSAVLLHRTGFIKGDETSFLVFLYKKLYE